MNKFFIQKQLSELTESKAFLIAYSGGLDSHVLLHSVSDYPNGKIRAIHIHHGLNPLADEWASHCQKVCDALNIPLITEKIQLTPHQNVEARARKKRYAVFARYLNENEVLLTAHHQNDQAETLLLQLFRGAGLKGLSSMPLVTTFSKGQFIRPFLQIAQSELQAYARLHQLKWIEDDSNQNLQFQRNFLRHNILPLLQTRWPSIQKTLARSCEHIANTQKLMESLAQRDMKNLLVENKKLCVSKLLQLTHSRQENVLRCWLMQLHFPLPSKQKLLSAIKHVLQSNWDATPVVQFGHTEIRRYRDHLYALDTRKKSPKPITYEWNLLDKPEISFINQTLNKDALVEKGINLTNLTTLTIRFRKGGERCKLKGHTHSKSLKKLFQEWGVPPWEREYVPLLYHSEHLIAVWGYVVCENFDLQTIQNQI